MSFSAKESAGLPRPRVEDIPSGQNSDESIQDELSSIRKYFSASGGGDTGVTLMRSVSSFFCLHEGCQLFLHSVLNGACCNVKIMHLCGFYNFG